MVNKVVHNDTHAACYRRSAVLILNKHWI